MDAFGALGLAPVGNGYHSGSDSDSETDGYFGQPLVADLELPEARSGHVAVAFGNCVIVWGGYTDRELNERYLPANVVWIFHSLIGKWEYRVTSGELPVSASGACAVCKNQYMYVFAGYTVDGGSSSIFELNLRTWVWRCLPTLTPEKTAKPAPRDKFVGWEYQNKLYYFGGFGLQLTDYLHDNGEFLSDSSTDNTLRGWNNQLLVFDLQTETWSNPKCHGTVPSPRAAHAACILGDTVYVFGGRHDRNRLNDFYALDLNVLHWKSITLSSEGPNEPAARSWHTLTRLSSTQLFLYGGFTQDENVLSDAWIIDTGTYKCVQVGGSTTMSRLWHTACTTDDDDIVIFGGCENNILDYFQQTKYTNKISIFRFQPKLLKRLCLEAAYDHRELLQSEWKNLPRTLYKLLLYKQYGPRALYQPAEKLCDGDSDTAQPPNPAAVEEEMDHSKACTVS